MSNCYLTLFDLPTAHNNIDLSQVSVPAKSSIAAVPATAVSSVAAPPLQTFGASPVQAVGSISPPSFMSQIVDAPKLTVRFPSFVTPDKLIENSIDR